MFILHRDLVLVIFSYLSFSELGRIARTCKYFKSLLTEDNIYDFYVYKRILTTDFGIKRLRLTNYIFMGINESTPWVCPNPKVTYRLVKTVCENFGKCGAWYTEHTFPAIYNYIGLVKKYLLPDGIRNDMPLHFRLELFIGGAARGNNLLLLSTLLQFISDSDSLCQWVGIPKGSYENIPITKVNEIWKSALSKAGYGGHIQIAEYLLSNYTYDPRHYRTSITCAVSAKHEKFVTFLQNKQTHL